MPARVALKQEHRKPLVIEQSAAHESQPRGNGDRTTAHRRQTGPDSGPPDDGHICSHPARKVTAGPYSDMPSSIAFHGAARTVTGSRHLLDIDGARVLVDCGLFQGPRELRERNWQPFAVDPASIDAVVLTHGHTDHIGYLPRLRVEGYRGPVYSTYGTRALAKVSLPDSGRLNEEEASYRNEKGITRHQPALPLFTEADAYASLEQFVPLRFGERLDLPEGATARFLPAGHILGSAFVEITLPDGQVLMMSGDLGRYDRPILRDPSVVEQADHLVLESTYGDRLHGDGDPKAMLLDVLHHAVRERGVVLVPSFAIGRTQELLWYLHELTEEGRMPDVPVYIDSPMANATTLLYLEHTEDHDIEMRHDLSRGRSPLRSEMVRFVRDKEASKALNRAEGPMMIIAGSGMITGGRIVHHLKQRLGDPTTTVLFTGYQSPGSRGRQLLDGAPTLNIHKQEIDVRARVLQMTMLSAHADWQETLRWLGGFTRPPKRTYLVHGDPEAQDALRDRVVSAKGWDVVIPEHGQRFEL